MTTLKNNLRIANFSSPHEFKFESGETLPGCNQKRVKDLNMDRILSENIEVINSIEIITNTVEFKTTPKIRAEIKKIQGDKSIDICLIPFPMLTAMKTEGINLGKFRVCLLADRIKKTIYSDRFSI